MLDIYRLFTYGSTCLNILCSWFITAALHRRETFTSNGLMLHIINTWVATVLLVWYTFISHTHAGYNVNDLEVDSLTQSPSRPHWLLKFFMFWVDCKLIYIISYVHGLDLLSVLKSNISFQLLISHMWMTSVL